MIKVRSLGTRSIEFVKPSQKFCKFDWRSMIRVLRKKSDYELTRWADLVFKQPLANPRLKLLFSRENNPGKCFRLRRYIFRDSNPAFRMSSTEPPNSQASTPQITVG